jgi:hypothetical protein
VVQNWCYENHMDLNIQKTNAIPFSHKISSIHFNYYIVDVLISCTECVKDPGVMLDSKLCFHQRVNCVSSWTLKNLGLIYFVTNNFSSLVGLRILYVAFIRSKLEYASVPWNNLTLADSNKLENIQKEFAKFYYG